MDSKLLYHSKLFINPAECESCGSNLFQRQNTLQEDAVAKFQEAVAEAVAEADSAPPVSVLKVGTKSKKLNRPGRLHRKIASHVLSMEARPLRSARARELGSLVTCLSPIAQSRVCPKIILPSPPAHRTTSRPTPLRRRAH